MIQHRYEITDEQWEQIEFFFPPYTTGRPSKKSNRSMFNAILWVARSGAAWRDLPERYGSWKTAYSRFCKWRESGLLVTIFQDETRRQILKTFVSTPLPSGPISTALGLKRGSNSRNEPAYWC